MASKVHDEVSTSAQGLGEAPFSAVGSTLRTAREKMGREIVQVASQLRIRQPYLQALEEGRHKDLPGGTYAIGFLRTYADFLGLDGEEMVRRFKQEADGDLHARSELVFPSPVSEGRIPSGALIFVGMVLFALAYGAWYWMSARQAKVTEIVPPLPDRLSSVLNRPAALTSDKSATPAAAEPAAQPAEAPRTEEAAKAPPPAEEAAKPVEKALVKEEVVPPSEGDEDGKAKSGKAVEAKPAEPAKPAEAKPADTKPADTKVKPAEAPKPADTKVKPAEAPKPADTKPVDTKAKPADAPKPADAVKPAEPAKPGEGAMAPADAVKDSRVTLRAIADDCWVQVRELDGQLLVSRLLHKGETYQVPNRPGLTLTVGNAGALEVAVDGKRIAPLGQGGQVRRDVGLDPGKLLSGG